jgi:hypothetical protein
VTEPIVTLLLAALGLYLGAGALFGLAFVGFGVGRIDPAARGAPWRVRLVLLPGAAALWPVLAARWARAGRADR